MRIVQLANFYAPTSGGQRTAIDEVGRGYVDRGHERILVVPGPRDADERGLDGRRVVLRSPRLPGQPYRVITDVDRVLALLDVLRPDAVEVSDKLTLWPVGRWARRRGVGATLWSHERLDAILAARVPSWFPLAAAADRWNARLVRSFDHVACASGFSRAELARVGARNVVHVPLGVDLETFTPDAASRASHAGRRALALVCAGRLSKEKRPVLAVEALRVLLSRGHDAHLLVAGDGPQAEELRARKARLPITFTGHVGDRRALAALLAGADVALAPCPVESFGLSVLEAMACGAAVVTSDRGAARELLAPGAGLAAASDPSAIAAAVEHLLAVPVAPRPSAARGRAGQVPWSATVEAMLRLHAGPSGSARRAPLTTRAAALAST